MYSSYSRHNRLFEAQRASTDIWGILEDAADQFNGYTFDEFKKLEPSSNFKWYDVKIAAYDILSLSKLYIMHLIEANHFKSSKTAREFAILDAIKMSISKKSGEVFFDNESDAMDAAEWISSTYNCWTSVERIDYFYSNHWTGRYVEEFYRGVEVSAYQNQVPDEIDTLNRAGATATAL